MNTTENIEDMAAAAYTNYCAAVGGVAFNGDPLPSWKEFAGDPGKTTQVEGWRTAVIAAVLVYDAQREPQTSFADHAETEKTVLAAIKQLRGSERGEAALRGFFRMLDGGGCGLDTYSWKALVELVTFCQLGGASCLFRVLSSMLHSKVRSPGV